MPYTTLEVKRLFAELEELHQREIEILRILSNLMTQVMASTGGE